MDEINILSVGQYHPEPDNKGRPYEKKVQNYVKSIKQGITEAKSTVNITAQDKDFSIINIIK